MPLTSCIGIAILSATLHFALRAEKLFRWLNRPDGRDRYPNGDLVTHSHFPGNVVERLADGLPLWMQRIGLFLLQGLAGLIAASIV